MKFIKIPGLFICLFPLSILGQSIQENLDYINALFAKFNKYDTSFDIDKVSKRIICRDKFGTYTAFFDDIEIKRESNGTNIGIFCLNTLDKCITSIQKDGSSGYNYSKYTMGLTEQDNPGDHIDIIIDKFAFIKKKIQETNLSSGDSQNQKLRYEVDLQLQKLNTIFKDHSNHQNTWSFDWENYWLVGKTSSCEVFIPLEKVMIESYERTGVENYQHGFVIKSTAPIIIEKCTSYENKVDKTFDYLDNAAQAEAAVDCFETIQILVGGEPTTIIPSPSAESIEQSLYYINDQFQKHNDYNTRFFVDIESKELIWISDFGETRTPADQVNIKTNNVKGWIIIDCTNRGSKCITFTSANGSKLQYSEYSMSLTENGKLIPLIEEVVEKFEDIINAVRE